MKPARRHYYIRPYNLPSNAVNSPQQTAYLAGSHKKQQKTKLIKAGFVWCVKRARVRRSSNALPMAFYLYPFWDNQSHRKHGSRLSKSAFSRCPVFGFLMSPPLVSSPVVQHFQSHQGTAGAPEEAHI